jgi:integrase
MRGSRRRIRGRGASSVWELRVHAGRNPVTGKPRYVSRTVKGTADIADEKMAELVDEVTGDEHDGDDITFGELLDRWLNHATIIKDLSPTTVREYKRLIEKNIKPVLGDVPLRQIDGGVLDDFYVSLMSPERGLSAASVQRCHSAIAAATKQAVKWKLIRGQDPAQAATKPTVRTKAKAVPTVAQVQKLIQKAEKEDPDMAALIALAAVTGARRGELSGLRWGDVDDEQGTLTIERSYAVVGGKHIFKPTKTHGVRCIALGDFGTEALRIQRARLEDRAQDAGVVITDATPILTYDLENPISPDTASHYVRDIATEAKIDTHLHALRHFAATQMIGSGQDVRTVAGRLGHADASTTLKVYAGALPQRDRDAAESLGRSLTPRRSKAVTRKSS